MWRLLKVWPFYVLPKLILFRSLGKSRPLWLQHKSQFLSINSSHWSLDYCAWIIWSSFRGLRSNASTEKVYKFDWINYRWKYWITNWLYCFQAVNYFNLFYLPSTVDTPLSTGLPPLFQNQPLTHSFSNFLINNFTSALSNCITILSQNIETLEVE